MGSLRDNRSRQASSRRERQDKNGDPKAGGEGVPEQRAAEGGSTTTTCERAMQALQAMQAPGETSRREQHKESRWTCERLALRVGEIDEVQEGGGWASRAEEVGRQRIGCRTTAAKWSPRESQGAGACQSRAAAGCRCARDKRCRFPDAARNETVMPSAGCWNEVVDGWKGLGKGKALEKSLGETRRNGGD